MSKSVYNMLEKEKNALLAEADATLKQYKETHEGWL